MPARSRSPLRVPGIVAHVSTGPVSGDRKALVARLGTAFAYPAVLSFCCVLGLARAQSGTEFQQDCGVAICIQSGVSNWRYEATQYCEADVCLRDPLDALVALDWDRMTAGQQTLFSAARNPYVGLADDAYQRLRTSREPSLGEQIALLATVRAACRPAELRLRLDVPGYDVVEVTFQVPLVAAETGHGFQVTQIRRTYRSLPGGSVGWWVRWISNRFPGIPLLDGKPSAFASYEIGLYMGGLVLTDIEFEPATLEQHARQPGCV